MWNSLYAHVARSRYNVSCRAWTIGYDPANGAATCNLVSTTATAYPQEDAISGYPIKEDSASYCEQLWASGQDQVWMDEDMSAGVDCAMLPPSGGGFPRSWHDGSGNGRNAHRGDAWFFFPSHDKHGPKKPHGDISGEWTTGNQAQDRFMITAEGAGKFSLLCITGGTGSDCDPTTPGKKGGPWHSATLTVNPKTAFVTIQYDNTLHGNGTFNPSFFKVTWADGSTWRRVGKCGCACHPPTDTGCNQMKCSGASLSDAMADMIIKDAPWIVYIHGGDFRYYNAINGGK